MLIAFCLPGFLYAQVQSTDSLALQHANDHPLKVKALIIPAVFLTYGALSFGNNPIRDLDLTTKANFRKTTPYLRPIWTIIRSLRRHLQFMH